MKNNISETRQSRSKPKKSSKPARKLALANISQRYGEVLRLRQRLSEAEAKMAPR
ncbi:hypothetical protein [Bradyrhizobium guangdongense]|uniref:hypothetical protein n=1 Tax=Bradyrhizobium guangdongense TaxID=1325090 RepID=UPI0013E8EB87|nr:hypothetical protein [Bradyrhizobium guangdongense]